MMATSTMTPSRPNKSQQTRTLRFYFATRFILPFSAILLVAINIVGLQAYSRGRADARDNITTETETTANAIAYQFQNVPNDMRLISTHSVMDSYLEAYEEAQLQISMGNTADISQLQTLLRRITIDVETLLVNRAFYDKVQLTSLNGETLFMVARNPRNNQPITITDDRALPNTPNAEYVQQGQRLKTTKDYWVSEVFLAQNGDGTLVEPYRPTIQIVNPILDSQGIPILLIIFDLHLNPFIGATLSDLDTTNALGFIVDSDGYYILNTDPQSQELLYGRTLNSELRLGGDLATQVLDDEVQSEILFSWENDDYVGTSVPLRPMASYGNVLNAPEWNLLIGQTRSYTYQEANALLQSIIAISLFIVVGTIAIIWFVPSILQYQFSFFATGIEQLSRGNLSVRLSNQRFLEFNQMTDTFNTGIQRIQLQIQSLEKRLQDRIRDLELTSEISREVAGLRDLSLVLNRTIGLIVERFGFYHAQVFLLDDVGEYAVLVASTGIAGQRLLTKKHKLAVGSNSVIGRVTALGVTVIAGDTTSNEVPWQPNEELPNTRSEMALPLKVEKQVIGALDIQSIRPEDYSISDIDIFQILADQLAIAISNARLINELERRVEDIANLNRRLTESAWESYVKIQNQEIRETYRYDLSEVQVFPLQEDNEIPALPASNERYSVPIEIGGTTFGTIEVSPPEQAALTREDQTVINALAARVSLAIENARLFEQTQTALAETQRLYEVARAISGAADLELSAVYQLIVSQLTSEENLDQVAILTAQPLPSYHASYLTVDYLWQSSTATPHWQVEDQLNLLLEGLSEVYEISPRETILLTKESLTNDILAYKQLTQIFHGLNSQLIFVIPLVSGTKWFGLMACGSQKPMPFRDSFRNFALAVADQLAIAIENRRLLEEVQTEARRALALAEASKLAGQVRGDLQTSLGNLFRIVAGPGEFNRWWFGLLQSDGTVLRRVSSGGPTTEYTYPAEIHLAKDRNALTETVHLQHVLLVNDFDQEHPVLGTIHPEDRHRYGKHLALPVMTSDEQSIGALLIGRDENTPDLDEQDIQLATTLVSQLAVAMENQRLYAEAENQRQTLQTALEALPAGVLLLSTEGQSILSNQRAMDILGVGVQQGLFQPNTYPIYRTNINEAYTSQTFPTVKAIHDKTLISDEIVVEHPDGRRLSLSTNVAPILNDKGEVELLVVVFQEITELRELEKALQASLSETTALYEASRTISTIVTAEDLTHAVQSQLHTLVPDYIFLIYQEEQEQENQFLPVLAAQWPEADSTDLDNLPLPKELLMADEIVIIDSVSNPHQNQLFGMERDKLNQIVASGIESLAVLPMKIRERTLGWISVGFRFEHHFISEERRFLTTIADQATIVLNNARLFESTQKALRAVANLYRSTRRIAEVHGIKEATEVMREELASFNADRIDLLLQRRPEDLTSLHFALAWSNDSSLTYVPSFPVDADTAEPQLRFEPLSSEDYIIQDIQTANYDAHFVDAMLTLDTPYRAFLSVPLRASGRTVGRLGMAFLHPRQFSPEDLQLVTTLASATAYIVENDLLFQQTQDSLEETGVLYQASRAIANAETRIEIVQAVIDYAASAPVDKVMLITLHAPDWDDPDAIIEVATWGEAEALNLHGLRFNRDQFPLWSILSKTQIFAVDNVNDHPEIDDIALQGCQALEIGAIILIPLKIETSARAYSLGAILIASSEPRPHEDREIRIYKSLADQAAVQLDNKRLFEQSELRSRQLTTSAQVSRAAISILNLDELFPQVVDLIIKAFPYDHVQIFILDDEGKHALLRASTGEPGRMLLQVKHSLPVGSRSVIGQVTAQGKPIIALDTTDAENVHRPNPFLPETRSEMAIPLIVKGKVVGALDVQSNQPRAFNSDDLRALTTLADQLAVAIDNAELYQTAHRRASEMKFLFDVTAAAAAAPSLNSALQTLAEVLVNQTEADVAVVYLYDAYARLLESQVIVEREENSRRTHAVSKELAFEPGHGIMGWMIKSLQPLVLPDVLADDRYRETFSYVRSGIYVPIIALDQLVGAIALESRKPNYFTDDTLRLLQTLGTTVATLIRNAQLLAEVQRTNEQLREIDQLKTNFLAAMSHELRTPLNSIIGFSRVILKGIDGPVNEMQQQDIQTIHESGKHLLRLVNDILDQAKVEAGKMDLTLGFFDIAAVVKSSMSTAVGLTKDKPIKLYSEVEENLSMVYGDEFRTQQILGNLLSNASKFTQEGSITVSVYAVMEGDRRMVHISVTDTGIGIAEKDFHKLFEAFQQVDNSTTRTAEGTGLGLPLAKSLAELQGGTLWVESEVGKGSTFYFSIPTEFSEEVSDGLSQLDKVLENSAEIAPPQVSTVPEIPPPPKKVILAIDDELGMINLYRRYLKKEDWQVIGIHKPERVEEMVALHNPQIILLDIQMPERDGWNVLQSLKTHAETAKIPVIICSIENDVDRGSQMGAAGHLVKPFVETDLIKTINEVKAKFI